MLPVTSIKLIHNIMKNSIKKNLILLIILCISIGQVSAQKTLKQHIDEIAEKYVSKKKNHSLVIGIAMNDQIVVESYGQLSKKDTRIPDENTVFEIGGITSVFTTSLMQLQSDRDVFYQGNPIKDYIDNRQLVPAYYPIICKEHDPILGIEPSINGHQGGRQVLYSCDYDRTAMPSCVTFCNLAAHLSSLPASKKGWYNWNPFRTSALKKKRFNDITPNTLALEMYRTELEWPPGTFFKYSPTGIALLGKVLSDINDKPYETMIQEEILFHLGMFDTYIKEPELSQRTFAPAHNRKGQLVEHWHFDAMAPAAGMRSTMRDMLYFLEANLHTASNDALPKAFEQVQQARFKIKNLKLDRPTMAGYGWLISTLNEKTNQPVIWANGGTGGFRSFIGMVKDTQIGIVILSNSANSVDKMAFEILELMHSQSTVKNKKTEVSLNKKE